MPNNQLKSSFAKIDRADYHLTQLSNKIRADQENKLFGISFIHEGQTDDLVISALIPGDLFMQYAIIAGDVIGQARSALEHTVWSMLPTPILRVSGFPVLKDAQRYETHGKRMIEGINADAEEFIHSLQPFNDHEKNLLYILNELWNRDKHRLLNFCVAYPQGIQLYSHPNNVFSGQHIQVPINVNHGTQLFREKYPGPEVKVGAEVIFKDGLVQGEQVTDLLDRLLQFSRQIIERLSETI